MPNLIPIAPIAPKVKKILEGGLEVFKSSSLPRLKRSSTPFLDSLPKFAPEEPFGQVAKDFTKAMIPATVVGAGVLGWPTEAEGAPLTPELRALYKALKEKGGKVLYHASQQPEKLLKEGIKPSALRINEKYKPLGLYLSESLENLPPLVKGQSPGDMRPGDVKTFVGGYTNPHDYSGLVRVVQKPGAKVLDIKEFDLKNMAQEIAQDSLGININHRLTVGQAKTLKEELTSKLRDQGYDAVRIVDADRANHIRTASQASKFLEASPNPSLEDLKQVKKDLDSKGFPETIIINPDSVKMFYKNLMRVGIGMGIGAEVLGSEEAEAAEISRRTFLKGIGAVGKALKDKIGSDFSETLGSGGVTASTNLRPYIIATGGDAKLLPKAVNKELSKRQDAELINNLLAEVGGGFHDQELLDATGIIKFVPMRPGLIKERLQEIKDLIPQTSYSRIIKNYKDWGEIYPGSKELAFKGVSKALKVGTFTRRDLIGLGKLPQVESLIPDLEKSGLNPKMARYAAGVLAAGILMRPEEAEGSPKVPKKALQGLMDGMAQWKDLGHPYWKNGKNLVKGDKNWDPIEAVDFIAEETGPLKELLQANKIANKAMFDPDRLIQALEAETGLTGKGLKAQKETIVKKAKELVEKPQVEKPTRVEIPIDLKKSAKSLPIKESQQIMPDSSANDILEEYGQFQIQGKTVQTFKRGPGRHRYILFDDGTYVPTTKDIVRSLVRDRGAEVYEQTFKRRAPYPKAQAFQALKSANERQIKHELHPLPDSEKWNLRDKYVKNIKKIRPERNPEDSKAMVNYGGQVMQIPKAYADLLIKNGVATPVGRK